MYSTTETTKGKKSLLFDGYCYQCDRIRGTNTYWRCEDYQQHWPGRARQKEENPPVLTSAHNHDPNKQVHDIAQFKIDLKHRVREEQTSLKQIYRSELIKRYSVNPDAVCALPQFYQLKNALYRTKNEHYPPLPKALNDVCIEGTFYCD